MSLVAESYGAAIIGGECIVMVWCFEAENVPVFGW